MLSFILKGQCSQPTYSSELETCSLSLIERSHSYNPSL